MLYQISIRRKAGITREKVGKPIPDHDEAVTTIKALLDERFPGEWRPGKRPDTWIVRNSLGAKVTPCDEKALAMPAKAQRVAVSPSPEFSAFLIQISAAQGISVSQALAALAEVAAQAQGFTGVAMLPRGKYRR